jgi:undecaprenyl-phosphate 4-deoxy-4-formamido-L-arabinose transferase
MNTTMLTPQDAWPLPPTSLAPGSSPWLRADQHSNGSSPVPQLSVVIPVYNESQNLKELSQSLKTTLEGIASSYEIIFVDDGSQDNSLKILLELQRQDARVIVVELTRNFGQHPALLAGFERARGETIVTLDADGQNPPQAISLLLDKMKEGYDVVGGRREKRQDPWSRRLASWMVNRFMSRAAGVRLNDYGCMLRAYHRDVIGRVLACKETSTFIPALASALARRVAEVDVPHRARKNGTSNYKLFKLLQLNFDFMTGFSILPIQLISALGLIVSLISFAVGTVLCIRSLVLKLGMTNAFNLRFSVTIFFDGLELMALGTIGEYIGRIYNEVRKRPLYLVRQVHEPPPPSH